MTFIDVRGCVKHFAPFVLNTALRVISSGPSSIALFTVNFFICITIKSSVNVRRFGMFCSFSPKLPHIHVGLHCNANEINYLNI